MKIKGNLKTWIGSLLVLAFIGFGLKSFIVYPWYPASEPRMYSIDGKDGRGFIFVFYPDSTAITFYTDQANKVAEASLMKISGQYGTHIVGNIWQISDSLFGYRIYPDKLSPINTQITVLKKAEFGPENGPGPKADERFSEMLLLGDDELHFQSMTLRREALQPGFADKLKHKFD